MNIDSKYKMHNSKYNISFFEGQSAANTSLAPTQECNAAATSDGEQFDSAFFGKPLAVPEWEAHLTVIVLSIIILLTIIGNILVILSVFTYKPLRSVQNFFNVSLAVSDLTVALLVLPFNVHYSILGRWEFGITMCKIWLTCDVMCCTSSILNLCVIALDRYWAITDPINYVHKRTLRRVLMYISGVWLLSLLISSPPLVGWNDWPEEFTSNTPCELNSNRGYIIYSSLGSFFIPLIVMTIVYVEIYIATKKRLRARARASKIHAMSLKRCSGALDTDKISTETESKRGWLKYISCSFCVTRTYNAQEDLDSVSSDNVTHNEIQPQRQVEIEDIAIDQTDTERLETTQRKKGRRPRIKDSIKKARNQLPQRRAKHTSKEQESTFKLMNTQVCIEVSLDNDDITSTNEDENVSLKTTPPQSSQGGLLSNMSLTLHVKDTSGGGGSGGINQMIEERKRISLSKERRAARILGIIMGVFVICWLPFSMMYVILPFCETCCPTNKFKNFITWLGYINSGINPVIYTVFNLDYRRAFKKLLRIN